MALVLLLASDVVDIHYDADNTWLYLDWKGPQELARVQAACERLTVLIEQMGARKALNDNTHVTATSWELAQWIAHDYLPLAGKAGVQYVAWVHSPLLSARSNIDLMAAFGDRQPQVAIFDNVAAAYEWLGSVTVPVG
jgi:hypothetical protein